MVGTGLFRIYLTGRITIEGDGVVAEDDLPGNQGRLLLALLGTRPGPVSKGEVASVLWGSDPPPNYERSINPLVSKLRSALVSVGAERDTVFSAGGAVGLRRGPRLWIDLEEAARRVDRAEGRLRAGDLNPAWVNAAVASAVVSRGFLSGIDSPWADEQRRVLASLNIRAHDVIVDVWLARGDPGQAVVAAERLVALNPLRETSYGRLIRAHTEAGNRAQAVRAYTLCSQVLRSELGVDPSPAVEDAYERALGL